MSEFDFKFPFFHEMLDAIAFRLNCTMTTYKKFECAKQSVASIGDIVTDIVTGKLQQVVVACAKVDTLRAYHLTG